MHPNKTTTDRDQNIKKVGVVVARRQESTATYSLPSASDKQTEDKSD